MKSSRFPHLGLSVALGHEVSTKRVMWGKLLRSFRTINCNALRWCKLRPHHATNSLVVCLCGSFTFIPWALAHDKHINNKFGGCMNGRIQTHQGRRV